MTNTNDLIAQLAQESKPATPAIKPGQLVAVLLGVLLVYAIGAQIYLGLRPDLINRLTDFWYNAEITTLWFLILTSAYAGVVAMSPDALQKPIVLKLPYIVLAALIVILGYQLITNGELTSHPLGSIMQKVIDTHGMACSICIALLSMLPSAFVFAILKKGASVRPLMSGSFAVFTAAGIGCLTLRLGEPNDSLIHLIQWHYLPTLLFAIIGAWMGKWLLKW